MKSAAILLMLTLLAGGAGVFHGLKLFDLLGAGAERTADHPAEAGASRPAETMRDLKPIVTNLAAPAESWVRLEATLVIDPKQPLDDKAMGEITNDIVAYLRTTTARQLEGAPGLRRLREDLTERMALRSANRVREVLIQTLVVQ